MKQAQWQEHKEHDLELSKKDRHYPSKCCKLSDALYRRLEWELLKQVSTMSERVRKTLKGELNKLSLKGPACIHMQMEWTAPSLLPS